MKLKLIRKEFTDSYTIGDLYIDGVFFCAILEDKDRGLHNLMTLEEISKIKVKGQTAIPYGTYNVVITYSPRFKRLLPLLEKVSGYVGIRMHPGNTEVDTDGCLLPGIRGDKKVTNSKATFTLLYKILFAACKREQVTIEITNF